MMSKRTSTVVLCAVGLWALAGCTDEGEGDGQGGGVASGGAGAGAGPSVGGAGGTATGGSGTGGGGSAPQGCLDAAPFSGLFQILDEDLCLYKVIDAPSIDASANQPSWGSHGGPLQVIPGTDTLSVVRWTLGPSDVLTDSTTSVSTTGIPADAFWGGLAVETAPSSQTCGDKARIHLAWTGSDFMNQGQVVTIGEGAAASQQQATGVYGMAGFGARLFYTGLSAADGPNANELGLYVADSDACDDAVTSAGKLAQGWGLAQGPVAVDLDGNVFAVMTDYVAGTQELHGYAADEAQGAGPIAGHVGATFDGFGDAFAAIAPSGAKPGLVMMQTNDATTFEYLDVVGQEYGSAGGDLTFGLTKDVLHFVAPNTNVSMFSDDQGRVWIGVPYHQKNAAFESTKFYVFGRTTAP